jgi:VIT1/CCC1 family predicted Fe2+/Mn2+ transporter
LSLDNGSTIVYDADNPFNWQGKTGSSPFFHRVDRVLYARGSFSDIIRYMMNINKFSIGATAAITTSMGLIAGLTQGDGARTSIITGLLIVAIADNVSDSLGIHIYKESEGASKHDINSFTYGNFIARLFIAFTFILIVLLFSSYAAFIISSLWGLVLLAILSYLIARGKGTNPFLEIAWHLVVALMIIVGSKILGNFILNMIS